MFAKMKSKTYGRYDGPQPVIVTKDPEIVKSVLVKNFDSFHQTLNFSVSAVVTPRSLQPN